VNVEPMPGWYEVSDGLSLHRITDGGYLKIRTLCGIRIRAAFRSRTMRLRQCVTCTRLDKKLSPGRDGTTDE
jgi:hypothetical protein